MTVALIALICMGPWLAACATVLVLGLVAYVRRFARRELLGPLADDPERTWPGGERQ